MQVDMHYYGTYVMAVAAGLNFESAQIVSTSAQFVDDCASKSQIQFKDAGQVDSQATAHHTFDVHNIDKDDQRQVWVPFHFLPGNQGNDFTERLICRKDSEVAREMVQTALENLSGEVAPYRLGITAHVYADTFAHYGFSGVGSRRNRVDNDSIKFGEIDPDIRDYITNKAKKFDSNFLQGLRSLTNIKSWLAENVSGALGHGAVATYPDRPYLNWTFTYEYPQIISSGERNNPETFLEACERLHDMFSQATQINPALGGGVHVSFDQIKDAVVQTLAFQGRCEERSNLWKSKSEAGEFGQSFEIPEYIGEVWLAQRKELHGSDNSEIALDSSIYWFYKAASDHRQYILRDLLPKHGLIVA